MSFQGLSMGVVMSDRQRAEFYRLQASQAQQERQEVFVLFTSKVRVQHTFPIEVFLR